LLLTRAPAESIMPARRGETRIALAGRLTASLTLSGGEVATPREKNLDLRQ
jgi:hypothetical protein